MVARLWGMCGAMPAVAAMFAALGMHVMHLSEADATDV